MSNIESIRNKLFHAVTKGMLDDVRLILDSEPSKQWSAVCVLFQDALKHKQTEIAKLLLSYIFTNNIKVRNFSDTPLHFAVRYKNLEIVQLILEKGLNVDVKNIRHETPLQLAVKSQDIRIVIVILNYGANIESKNIEGMTALQIAVQYPNEKIVELLIKRGAWVNVKDDRGMMPLHLAAKEGHYSVVECLLSHEAAVRGVPDVKGYTPLHYAVIAGCEGAERLIFDTEAAIIECRDIIISLIEHGASIMTKNNNGDTPFHLIGSNGQPVIVKTLLKYLHKDFLKCKSNMNISKIIDNFTVKGCSLLHFASGYGNVDLTKFLISKGVNVNALDDEGKIPLHYAVNSRKFNVNDSRSTEIVKILLEYITNVDVCDKENKAPIYYSAAWGNTESTKLLLDKGSYIDAKYYNGNTVLHTAVKNIRTDVIQILLDNEININITNNKGHTAFAIAFSKLSELRNLTRNTGNRNVNNDISKMCFVLFIHAVKLKALGFPVHKKYLLVSSYFSEEKTPIFGLNKYQIKYEDEVKRMKIDKIGNSSVCFYDILTKDIHKLTPYLANTDIAKTLMSHIYETEYPSFGNMINCRVKKAIKRKELLEQANKFFNSFFKLPFHCVVTITSYLSNIDLNALIISCDIP